jgi:transposase
VRLARAHAAKEILGVGDFDEDDLYANLDWLAKQQPDIEKVLFEKQGASEGLFLYDVTSTYLEGKHNAFGAFGYNRDGKRGKLQIVVGLLCNGAGRPLAIEVFPGNTQDTKTFASQVDKVAQRFGGGEITFVGDRGMIRGPQIKALHDEGFHFITAITKPQIEALLTKGVLQMSLFDAPLAEITATDGQRYILRRNPERAQEIASSRTSKHAALKAGVVVANEYLASHPRAKPDTQLKKLQNRARKLRIDAWTTLSLEGRAFTVGEDADALTQASKLDGCYVLKTDLSHAAASKDIIHDRYKDLALVEWAFRESKTVHLEIRPVNVRLKTRTRGHVFVVMLAYSIIHALAKLWRDLDLTVQEGLDQLATLCLTEILLPDRPVSYQLPTPRDGVQQLIDAAQVRQPAKIVPKASPVATKTKLPSRRK